MLRKLFYIYLFIAVLDLYHKVEKLENELKESKFVVKTEDKDINYIDTFIIKK